MTSLGAFFSLVGQGSVHVPTEAFIGFNPPPMLGAWILRNKAYRQVSLRTALRGPYHGHPAFSFSGGKLPELFEAPDVLDYGEPLVRKEEVLVAELRNAYSHYAPYETIELIETLLRGALLSGSAGFLTSRSTASLRTWAHAAYLWGSLRGGSDHWAGVRQAELCAVQAALGGVSGLPAGVTISSSLLQRSSFWLRIEVKGGPGASNYPWLEMLLHPHPLRVNYWAQKDTTLPDINVESSVGIARLLVQEQLVLALHKAGLFLC